MCQFCTPGKWYIAPPMFDGDVIFAPPQHEGRRNEAAAMSITKSETEKIKKALDSIDGTEE